MILIDMKFPECCFSCGLSHSAFYRCLGCSLTGKTITADRAEKMRMKDCPLVALPPHGRLIDADALADQAFSYELNDGDSCSELSMVFLKDVEKAPTVIPAELETEETQRD